MEEIGALRVLQRDTTEEVTMFSDWTDAWLAKYWDGSLEAPAHDNSKDGIQLKEQDGNQSLNKEERLDAVNNDAAEDKYYDNKGLVDMKERPRSRTI